MNKILPFIKMQGLGNDYIFVDCFSPSVKALFANNRAALYAQRLSQRRWGIGSDGLVLIEPSDRADCKMRIFNADGSEAQMCGNAIRCVGKWAYESGLCRRNEITVETQAGIKTLHLHTLHHQVDRVAVKMGTPIVQADRLQLNSRTIGFTSVNMGNPHMVIVVEQDPQTIDLSQLGPLYATHPHFPEGTNVEFIQILDAHSIKMRVWERGSGETLACGTGACAACVAASFLGKADRDVTVHLPGGDLHIIWSKTGEVIMEGPATEVYHGEYIIEQR